DAAGEIGRDVELLPRFEIGPDHDRDLGVELHDGSEPSFRDARSADPESRDSGSGAAHRPGMTFVTEEINPWLTPWRRRPRRGSRIPCHRTCSIPGSLR